MTPLDDDAWAAWSPANLASVSGTQSIHGTSQADGLWTSGMAQTREHEDLDFVVMRNDANSFRVTFNELDFFTVQGGAVEYLPPSAKLPSDVWQLWGQTCGKGVGAWI